MHSDRLKNTLTLALTLFSLALPVAFAQISLPQSETPVTEKNVEAKSTSTTPWQFVIPAMGIFVVSGAAIKMRRRK